MGNVRVRGHDYHGKGYYFITFGTLNRRQWLSRIVDGRVRLEPDDEPLECKRENCLKNNGWVLRIACG